MDKCLLVALTSVLYHLWLYLWANYTANQIDLFAYFDPSKAKALGYMLLLGLVYWTVLSFLCLRIKARKTDADRMVTLMIHSYSVSLLVFGYYTGILSMVVGVIWMGAPLTAFILFPAALVFRAFLVGMIGILVLAVLGAMEVIAYSPLLKQDPFTQSDAAFYWVMSQFYLCLPFVLTVFALVASMVKRWQERERQIKQLSEKDPLTSLWNRRYLFEQMERELARAKREQSALSFVMLDLDHFKQINDIYGHQIGDEALVLVGRVLLESVRRSDIVGRYGGEEFAIMLPNTSAEKAREVAERCRQSIEKQSLSTAQGTLTLSASLGLVSLNVNPQTEVDNLIHFADEALYRAKTSGRNRVVESEAA